MGRTSGWHIGIPIILVVAVMACSRTDRSPGFNLVPEPGCELSAEIDCTPTPTSVADVVASQSTVSPTSSPTPTQERASVSAPTPELTTTSTRSPDPKSTPTPAPTFTPTPTLEPTSTPTATPTSIPTQVPSPTSTATPTPTPTVIPSPSPSPNGVATPDRDLKPTPYPNPEQKPSGLPPNVASEYLLTVSSGFEATKEDGVWKARYRIAVDVIDKLPDATYLEASFENPTDPNNPMVVGQLLESGATQLTFESPFFTGLDCKSYRVDIMVYSDSAKTESLGLHIQWADAGFVTTFVKPGAENC